jgi:hypothetical protein
MRSVRSLARTVALLAATALPPALAQQPGSGAAPASGAGTHKAAVAKVARITAKVEALDRAARTITLRGSRGGITLAAGPEVRGFDLVRVGDFVVARYLEPVLVDIRKGGADARERIEPGAEGAARRVTVPAEVVAKDATKRTVTLRGAKQTLELKAAGGEQLKSVQVGDRVVAIYTEPAAVSIELAVSRPSDVKK